MLNRKPKLTIRRARQGDLVPICRLIVRTVNNLYRRVGRKTFPTRTPNAWPIMAHWLGSDPKGMLVAVNNRKQVVGHAGSIVRGKEWYLCNLFVAPNLQSRGLGAQLLEKSLAYGRERGCRRYALCTFAENPQAVAFYTRFGLPAQRAVLMLRRKIAANQPLPEIGVANSLTCRLVEDENFVNRLNRLDKRARDITRPEEHLFWLAQPESSTYAFFDDRKLAGYAVIHARGLVGPLAASEPKYLPDLMASAVNIGAAECKGTQIVFLQGEREKLLQMLLAAGFRVDEVLLEMATEKLADTEIYIPGSLAYY